MVYSLRHMIDSMYYNMPGKTNVRGMSIHVSMQLKNLVYIYFNCLEKMAVERMNGRVKWQQSMVDWTYYNGQGKIHIDGITRRSLSLDNVVIWMYFNGHWSMVVNGIAHVLIYRVILQILWSGSKAKLPIQFSKTWQFSPSSPESFLVFLQRQEIQWSFTTVYYIY